jgi:hypothetical protein
VQALILTDLVAAAALALVVVLVVKLSAISERRRLNAGAQLASGLCRVLWLAY